MKALEWHGTHDIRMETAPDPLHPNPRDAIVRITPDAPSAAPTCTSTTATSRRWRRATSSATSSWARWSRSGSAITKLKVGDRVVVPFTISCGTAITAARGVLALRQLQSATPRLAEKVWGHSPAGIFGYSHLLGRLSPAARRSTCGFPTPTSAPIKVPDGLTDEQVLFLSDIFPTGYMAAENCDIQTGRYGGRLGLRTGRASSPSRARVCSEPNGSSPSTASKSGCCMAEEGRLRRRDQLRGVAGAGGAQRDDRRQGPGHVHRRRRHGSARHGWSCGFYDKARQSVRLQTDRPHVLREAIQACRKGGIVSIPGVYGGLLDKINFGAAFQKGLTFRMGQTHVQKYMPRLLRYDQARRDRPVLRHHAPTAAGGRAPGLRDVPGQGRAVHQGRAQTMRGS